MTETIARTETGAAGEAGLVRRAIGGEADAFAQIMRQYNRRLFRVTYSILKDAAEAEDAVQEAYIRAFTGLGSLADVASFPTWLVTIAVNEARGRLRRSRRVTSLEDEPTSIQDGASAETMPMFTVPPNNPERLAVAAELRRVLESAIDALPGPFRTVFMLRGVEQLSVEETARCLGIPSATVKTRFHRARALLRQALQAEAIHALPQLYPFDGARCDRIVAIVLGRVAPAPDRQ